MSCIVIDLGPNVTAFSCSRGSRTKAPCAYCKARPAELLCDQPLRGARAGRTCDGKLCHACAFAIPGESNRHLCPPHRRERDEAAKRAAAADAWLDALAQKPAAVGVREVSASQVAAVPEPACICPASSRWPHYGDPNCPRHRIDRDALVDLFPNWNEWEHDDSPPVSQLAGEVRSRRDKQLDATFERARANGVDVSPHDEQIVREFATALVPTVNMYGCMPCPVCKTEKRWPHKTGVIICDDCGHEVQGTQVGDRWVDEPLASATSRVDEARMVSYPRNPIRMVGIDCSRRHNRCSGCGGCAVVARDFPLANDCRPCKWDTCEHAQRKLATSRGARATEQPIAEKVEHVRNARQTRAHRCHWTGCRAQCKPAYFMCREHWQRLPQSIRDRIWRTYRAGQEETLTPSREYLDATNEAQAWIAEWIANNQADAPRRGWEATVRETRARDAARVSVVVGGAAMAPQGDAAIDAHDRQTRTDVDIDADDFEDYGPDPGAGYDDE